MALQIRRLNPQDAEPYRELRLRALREHPEAFTSSYEEDSGLPLAASQQRLTSPHQRFWGAYDGVTLCGMIGLEVGVRAKDRHKGTVVGMYVAPECTGKGFGEALVAALLHDARVSGLGLLVLTVTEGNDPARRLYERMGFRSFGIEPGAVRVGGQPFGKNHMFLQLQGE
jgi:ribosomal protein S18 acetylase RimI-like enzyme